MTDPQSVSAPVPELKRAERIAAALVKHSGHYLGMYEAMKLTTMVERMVEAAARVGVVLLPDDSGEPHPHAFDAAWDAAFRELEMS